MPQSGSSGPPEIAAPGGPRSTAMAAPAKSGRTAPERAGQGQGQAGTPVTAPPLRLSVDPAPSGEAVSHRGLPCPGLAECPERPRLVRRLYDAAEREIEAVEASLGGPSATAARRLGALAATLDRLAALDRKALAGRTAARAPAGDLHAEAHHAEPVAAPVDAEAWAEGLAAQLAPGKAGGARGPA
ncbi:hypothetical protein [Phreatobacter sp.]|uniref:hypothetical protein n=1 Tax=Phreatobacter sp. TaxID=1966341 RepID=UPI003F704BAA